MKAAVINAPQTLLVVEDLAIDKPIGREVLVKTAYCGVCHSDMNRVDRPEAWYGAPTVMGHEASGIVEAIGPDVTEFEPGDHVITCNSVFCGKCRYCLVGRTNLCENRPERPKGMTPRLSRNGEPILQQAGIGGFGEQMLIHENGLVKIRKDMPLDKAALIGCGVLTGVGAALNRARIAPGSTVVVFGCGGIGTSVVQGARIAGALRIIAVDINSARLETARDLGATDLIDASRINDVVAMVPKISDGGVDYAFEAAGSAELAGQAFECLRDGGQTIMLGVAPPGARVSVPAAALRREKILTGSSMGSNHFKIDMPQFIEFYFQGRLKLDELISRHIRLDDINDAFELMRKGDGMRSVIKYD